MAKNNELVGLNKELLIWRGFTQHGRVWTYPDGVDVAGRVPCFPEDFNACLKWIMPKVEYCEMKCSNKLRYPSFMVQSKWNTEPHYGQAKTHALAFCLAVRKLINAEDKKIIDL